MCLKRLLSWTWHMSSNIIFRFKLRHASILTVFFFTVGEHWYSAHKCSEYIRDRIQFNHSNIQHFKRFQTFYFVWGFFQLYATKVWCEHFIATIWSLSLVLRSFYWEGCKIHFIMRLERTQTAWLYRCILQSIIYC